MGLNDNKLEHEVKVMTGRVVGELLEMQNKGEYRFEKKAPRLEKLRLFGKVMNRFRAELEKELLEEAKLQE